MWQSGEAVIVDVRGLSEYREGHIPNAKHIHAGARAAAGARDPEPTDP
jgi:rhodanese-related sulfurtransferase